MTNVANIDNKEVIDESSAEISKTVMYWFSVF